MRPCRRLALHAAVPSRPAAGAALCRRPRGEGKALAQHWSSVRIHVVCLPLVRRPSWPGFSSGATKRQPQAVFPQRVPLRRSSVQDMQTQPAGFGQHAQHQSPRESDLGGVIARGCKSHTTIDEWLEARVLRHEAHKCKTTLCVGHRAERPVARRGGCLQPHPGELHHVIMKLPVRDGMRQSKRLACLRTLEGLLSQPTSPHTNQPARNDTRPRVAA